MAITKEKKKDIVKLLREDLSKQKVVLFAGFKGLSGEGLFQIRKELRDTGAKVFVARKTLAKIAFEKEGVNFDPLSLDGEVGFIFGFEDGISTIKGMHKFVKEEKISVLGGFFEERFISSEEVMQLALLPSREELLGKLLGTMSAPLGGLLRVLQGNIKGLLYVLASAKQDK